jgi:hypothetical protein
MQHSKKISDLLIDAKIERWKKPNMMVLVENKSILWALGIRKSELTRLAEQASLFIRIDWHLID